MIFVYIIYFTVVAVLLAVFLLSLRGPNGGIHIKCDWEEQPCNTVRVDLGPGYRGQFNSDIRKCRVCSRTQHLMGENWYNVT